MCFDPISLLATMGLTSAGTAAAGAAGAAGTAAAGSSIMGTIGTIASIGSGVVGAVSSIQGGNAAAAAASATAQQQERAAIQAMEASEREAMLTQRRAAQMRGENRVALAAQGVNVNSVEALELLENFDTQVEEDLFAIRENGVRAANSYGQDAANSRAQGASAKSQGRWGAGSSLLSTAARVGERWRPYVYQNRVTAQGGYN